MTNLLAPFPILGRLIACLCLLMLAAHSANAQELLRNRSFEDPVAPNPGNNFYASIPEWTISNQGNNDPNPFNIVRPTAALCCTNATQTPAGGGDQYLDVSGTWGQLNQDFTIAEAGMISFSGWFSVRDFPQNLSGMFVRVRNLSNGLIVATSSVSFSSSEPIGLWKQALVDFVPVAAGTYRFEAFIPNPANLDLVSVTYARPISLQKSSAAHWDPVSSYANPKKIPGGVITYSINIEVPPDYDLPSNSLLITDPTPSHLALIVADFQNPGSGPVQFDVGSGGVFLPYSGLTSATDGVEFSNNGGLDWNYQPVIGPDGSDPSITAVRIRPSGTMPAGTTATVKMRYVIR